jgi:phospholipid/cholesterol/gamma-HCH transport system substrate-binding protein
MASQNKVKWAQLRTGILASVAMIIAAVLIFLLTGQSAFFEAEAHLKTFMEDSAGMTSNAPVHLNGIVVGHVSSIVLSGSRDPKKTVEIDLVLPEKYLVDIPDDSKAALTAANLLGDKYVNITKGTHPKHIEDGGTVEALPTQDIPQMMAQSTALLAQMQTIVGRVDGLLSIVESGQGNIGKLIKDDTLYDRANATMGELQQIVNDVRNSNGTLSHLLYDQQFFDDIKRPIQRLDDMLVQVQQGKGTLGKTINDPQLYDEARASITEAKMMLANLNAGKGTAGKILTDDQLYNQLDTIVQKVSTAVDKINSGQGTIGQLLVNPQLYDSLNGATREMDQLVKDVRANPKKFLRIKLALF